MKRKGRVFAWLRCISPPALSSSCGYFHAKSGAKKSVRELRPDNCCCTFFYFDDDDERDSFMASTPHDGESAYMLGPMQTSVPIHFGSTTMNEVHARIIIAYRLGMRSGREPVYLKATVSAELWNESCDTAFSVFMSTKWTSCYQNGSKMNVCSNDELQAQLPKL